MKKLLMIGLLACLGGFAQAQSKKVLVDKEGTIRIIKNGKTTTITEPSSRDYRRFVNKKRYKRVFRRVGNRNKWRHARFNRMGRRIKNKIRVALRG